MNNVPTSLKRLLYWLIRSWRIRKVHVKGTDAQCEKTIQLELGQVLFELNRLYRELQLFWLAFGKFLVPAKHNDSIQT